MKFRNIKINGFGNLIDKEYEFKDSINLIQGKNESGKSTMMGFLNSMFFGLYKTRKKNEISDDIRYKPWNHSEFSGLIRYELDNGEVYTVFRDFENKRINVLDNKNQDITKKYGVSREIGSNFLEEQIGIDKSSFALSSYTMQNSVVLNASDKNQMVQKLSNLISTGEDNISYKNLIKRIQDKRRTEVGTSKTQNMPINQVEKRLTSVRQEIKNIEDKFNDRNNISEEERETRAKFRELELKRGLISKLKESKIKDETNVEVIESIKEKIREKHDVIKERVNKKHDVIEKDSVFKRNLKKYIVVFILALVLEGLVFLSLKYFFKTTDMNKMIYSLLPVPIIAILFMIFVSLSNKMSINKDYDSKTEENREIEKEVNLIRKEVLFQEKEVAKLEKMKITQEQDFKQRLVSEFCGDLDDSCLNDIINFDFEKLLDEEKEVESEYTRTMYRLSTVDVKKERASQEKEELVGLEEKLTKLEEEKSELEDLAAVYEIALSGLEEAYEEIKASISPSFVNNLSKITKKITDGKYKSVILSEEQDILVQLNTGEYIDLIKLSVGTIEQINLALRLSVLKELTDEKIPILLDETFVFYDEDRLKNILDYLVNEENRQVLLFTCSEREKNLLNEYNIDYHYIEMR